MTIDQKQAIAFLEALTGGRNPLVTFQTFGDNQESKDRGAAIVRHGPLSGEVYKQLKYRHGKGGGVFVMVNEGDCKGRTAQNVVKVRALFLDTDGAPMEPARDQLRPHIVVESSLGKYHLYWRVSDCPLEQFPLLQKAIAARFGGDRSVHDLPRVMRLPGFWHQKGTPVMTRLVKTADFPPYTIAEVVEGLGLVLESAGTRAKAQDRPRVEALPTVSEDAPFEIVDPATGETVDLVDWAVKHPDFRLASALREHAPPDVLGGDLCDGKQHIRCPFEHEHSEQSTDTATFCTDGEAAKKAKGFVVKCLHSHCTDRDRLAFIKEMLLCGWIPVSALTNSAFLADVRRPKYVDYQGDELQKHPGFTVLRPEEQGRYLALFLHIGCFIEEGGSVPDDPRRVCRYLNIPADEWQELRQTFLELDLCRVEGGRLVSDLFSGEYNRAKRAYNEKIRMGRKGGSSKAAGHNDACC